MELQDAADMSDHFNGLTAEQAELLALLSEECGELVQIIGKTMRHGLDSYHPVTKETNRRALTREMGDVRAAMLLLCEAGTVSKLHIHQYADDKLSRVQRCLHHYVHSAGEKDG